MLRERLNIAQDIARQLTEAERKNDEALVATARLAAAMLEGRIKLNAAAQVGQCAFDAVASTFERQATSRKLLIEAHGALDDTRRHVGLEHYAIGGAMDKEVPPPQTGSLELVRERAA